MDATVRLWNSFLLTDMFWQGAVLVNLYINGARALARDCIFKIDNASGVFQYNANNSTLMQKEFYDCVPIGLWTDWRTTPFTQQNAPLGNKLNFYFSLNGFVIDREKNPIN
jgi:hypothetical protein